METDGKQEPEQEPPEAGLEPPDNPDDDDEVEAHAEQEPGEDKPWCIGCAQ